MLVRSTHYLFFLAGAEGPSFRSALEPLSKRGNFRRLSARFNYSGSYGSPIIFGRARNVLHSAHSPPDFACSSALGPRTKNKDHRHRIPEMLFTGLDMALVI